MFYVFHVALHIAIRLKKGDDDFRKKDPGGVHTPGEEMPADRRRGCGVELMRPCASSLLAL
jgi:hypothetical protein